MTAREHPRDTGGHKLTSPWAAAGTCLGAGVDAACRLAEATLDVHVVRVCLQAFYYDQLVQIGGIGQHMVRLADPKFGHQAGPGDVPIADITSDACLTADQGLLDGSRARFRASMPLLAPPSLQLGVLSVLDVRPRRLSRGQRGQLEKLAQMVSAVLLPHLQRRDFAEAKANPDGAEDTIRELEQALALSEKVGHLHFWHVDYVPHQFHWSMKQFRTWRPHDRTVRPPLDDGEATFHPDDQARLDAGLQAAIAASTNFECQARLITSGGEIRQVLSEAVIRYDAHGQAVGLLGVCRDVTELERVRQEMRDDANRRRAVQDAAQDAYVGIDASGRITAWNTAAETIFGWSANEAIGQPLTSTIIPAYACAAHDAGMARAMRTGERAVVGKRLELTAQDREGRIFPIEITLSETEVHGIIGFGAFIRDISERLSRERALLESEARYRALIDASASIVWRAASDGAIIDAQGWSEFCGQDSDALKNDGWLSMIHPDDRINATAVWLACVAEKRLCQVEYRVLHVSGDYRWCAAKGVPLFNTEGEIVEWVGTVTDIHEPRQSELRVRESEAALRTSEERLALAIDSGSDGLWDWDITTGKTWFSDRWVTMLGYEPGELDGHVGTWERLVHPDDKDRAVSLLTSHFEGATETYECEHRLRRKDGGWSWVLARGKVVARAASGAPLRIVGTHIDTTERREAERRIAHMARHDGLTDLPNRTLFLERLAMTLSRLSSDGGAVLLLLLDLDRFKTVNDTLGHQAGDALLCEVARRLRRVARASDTVARLGGDEFAIIRRLPSSRGDRRDGEMQRLASKVADALSGSSRPTAGIRTNAIEASIGLALAERGSQADDLFRKADLALYRAKAEGRATYRIYSPSMDEAVEARQRLELDLKVALTRGEFEVHYQPILDLASGRVCSHEALVRWRHPERGTIPPSEFIPLAEESGLIVPLGEWVLREASRQASTWQDGDVRVAVNISAVQFRSGNLASIVASALAASGLPPHRLELEITETVLMGKQGAVTETLDMLRRLGVRIALDDFGTGYSSLSYLRQFPINKIKIDRSFIGDIANADTAAIVRAIISLGRQLGMGITAEGVETEDQLATIRREGCTEAQGFLIGRPVIRETGPQTARAVLPFDVAKALHSASLGATAGGYEDQPRARI